MRVGSVTCINRNQIQNILGEWSKYYCRLENESLFLRCPFKTKCACSFPINDMFQLHSKKRHFLTRTKLANWSTGNAVFRQTYSKSSRLSADTQLVSQTVTQQVSDGLRSGMMTLAGVGMMFYMSPQVITLKTSRNIVPFSWHLWVWLWYLLSQYGECSWARKWSISAKSSRTH